MALSVKSVIFGINLGIGLLTLVAFYSSSFHPRELGIFSLFHLILPFFVLLNILYIILWLFWDWRRAFLSFVILLFGYDTFSNFFHFNTDESKLCRSNELHIMTYNLYGLKNLKDTIDHNYQQNLSEFHSFIYNKAPDILCVQENNPFSHKNIRALDYFKEHHYFYNYGTGIYSKYPIYNKGYVDFGGGVNSCLWADILINGRPIRVYSRSPSIKCCFPGCPAFARPG